ncbi:MAG TPA: MFS transporter [Candidatus Angelobacter sp.]
MQIGNYEIVEQIGAGAMGVVYKARHMRVRRTHLFALKLMNSVIADRPDLVSRFHREIEVVGRLEHPNIVSVVDAGEHQGSPYLVMEFLSGESLEKYIHDRRPIVFTKKLEIMAGVCRGLDYAHQQGVVHRDVKPANIILLPDLTPKILDFGVAHIADHTMTKTGLMVGTVSYMSPEQLNGARVDGRSDVFSCAIVLYEFLSNHLPFEGADTAAILKKILMDAPPPLRQFVQPCPLQAEAILARGLAKDPKYRYSAREMATELDELQHAELITEAAADAAMQATVLAPSARAIPKPLTEPPPPAPVPLPSVVQPPQPEIVEEVKPPIAEPPPVTAPPQRFVSKAAPVLEESQPPASSASPPVQSSYGSQAAAPAPAPVPPPSLPETRKGTWTPDFAAKLESAPEPAIAQPAPAEIAAPRPQTVVAAPRAARSYLSLTLLTIINFATGFTISNWGAIAARYHLQSSDPIYILYLLVLPLIGYLADRKFPERFSNASVLFGSVLLVPGAVGPAHLCDLFPAEKRGRILSIFYLSLALGPSIAYPLYKMFGFEQGWMATIPAGIVAAIIFVATRGPSQQQQPNVGAARSFLTRPAYWLLVISFAFLTCASVLIWTDISLYGIAPGIVLVIGLASVAGGWIADLRFKRNRSSYFMVPVFALVLAGLIALVGANEPMRNSIPFLSASRLFLLMSLAPVMAALVSVLPSQARTTALSVNVTASGLLTVALFSFFGRDAHFLRDLVAVIAIGISAVALFIAPRFAAQVAIEVPGIQVDVGIAEAVLPRKSNWRKWLIRIGIVIGALLAIVLLLSVLGRPANVRTLRSAGWDSINAVAYSPDGRYLVDGGHDFVLFDLANGSFRNLWGNAGPVYSVAFSHDGKYIAAGSSDSVGLLEVATGTPIKTFTGHTDTVNGVAFSPDGEIIASGSGDKTIKLWNIKQGKEERTLMGHTGGVSCIAFSPDGQFLASGSWDGTIKIWDVGTGVIGRVIAEAAAKTIPSPPKTLTGHSTDVKSVAYSPDGKYLVSGSLDSTVKLWEVATGVNRMTWNSPGNLVESVAFSPDGKYVAAAGGGPTIKLWEVASGQEVRTLEDIDSYLSAIWHKLMGNRRWVGPIAFSPDGNDLATGESKGVVNIWDLRK